MVASPEFFGAAAAAGRLPGSAVAGKIL